MSATTEWPLRAEDLHTFEALNRPTRHLILRLLGMNGQPTGADFEELNAHPQGKALASWLLELPAYAAQPESDDEGAHE